MKKLIILLLLFLCAGCETKEEEYVIPVVSNIELLASTKTAEHATEGTVLKNAIEYRFTLEPYNLLGTDDSNAYLIVTFDMVDLFSYLEPMTGIKYSGGDGGSISETIPTKSDTPIILSVYYSFHYELTDIITLAMLEGYLPYIKEVSYTIRMDDKTVDTGAFEIIK